MKKRITTGDCCFLAAKLWLQRVTTNSARQLLMIITLVFVSGIFSGQILADPIPGFTGPDPDNAFSFDIEGCKLDKVSEGTYDPTATPPVLYCDTSATWPATDDAYTDGNLGKQWEELDLVPHRFLSDSTGLSDASQTFQIVLGADNLIDDGLGAKPLAIGYDRIVNIVFRNDLSTGDATDCVLNEIGGNSIGDFGIGGAIEQIVQVIEITQNQDKTCVWDYVERLAITSSNISGSSNRSYVVAGTGAQSVPIPSDIQPQQLSKSMSAVEDSLLNWTISKGADPVTFDFANTCIDEEGYNTKDVTVTVEFTKGDTDPSSLTATSMVTAVNPSSRDVTYDCTDVLYGVLADAGSESKLDTQEIEEVVEPGMETFDLTHVVPPGSRQLRNELTCTLAVEDILDPGEFIVVGELDAAFSLPDSDIADGDVVNSEVVITDVEQITGNGFTFSAVQVATGVTGAFQSYTPGNSTTGPITWVSNAQSDSGTIQFTKAVTVARFIDTSGTLSDKATLPLTGVTDVEASASTSFTAGALVDLKIIKNIPDILQGSETIACNFTVENSSDETVASPVLNFSAGDTQQMTTITGLKPDNYSVIEGECGGLVPSGGSTQMVDLTLDINSTFADCSGTVTFNNIVGAGSAVAEVNKVTMPVGFEDGWEMTLKGPGTGDNGITLTTADGNPAAFERFLDPDLGTDFLLLEGMYATTEVLKVGWENTASSGCSFTIDYPDDFGAVKQCLFTNKQLGTIIIEKLTDPAGGIGFGYTDDIDSADSTGSFVLDDTQTKTFYDVPMGTYEVIEDDPAPLYDLVTLVCTDDYDDNGYNVNDSSTDLDSRKATIKLDPGETVKCTYTNRKRAMAQVIKTESGTTPVHTFDFELRVGADTSSSGTIFATGSSDSTGIVKFGCNGNKPDLCTNDADGNAKIVPGDYQLCEVGMMPGWSNDIDGFTPDSEEPEGGDNSSECIDITLAPGEMYSLDVDNRPPPDGDARTIGFWKNWTSCDGHGHQDAVLDANLPVTLDTDFVVDKCPVAVDLLDKRKVGDDENVVRDGKKSASDPIYNMVAQLVAAKLNLKAGAGGCDVLTNAIIAADALLTEVGFDGNMDYKKGQDKLSKAQKAEANTLAGILDKYNNNELCPPSP